MNTRPELITKLQTALSKCGEPCLVSYRGSLVLTRHNIWLSEEPSPDHDALFVVYALDKFEEWDYDRNQFERIHDRYRICVWPSKMDSSALWGGLEGAGPDRAHAVAEALLAVATQRALPSMAVVEGE